jgi:hypothetical protein
MKEIVTDGSLRARPMPSGGMLCIALANTVGIDYSEDWLCGIARRKSSTPKNCATQQRCSLSILTPEGTLVRRMLAAVGDAGHREKGICRGLVSSLSLKPSTATS